ncbi:MAG: hypothetical protein HS115_00915 [Spirochaetales bacterium]|nr:hypothetical protein [Spirochaetales bacterium]
MNVQEKDRIELIRQGNEAFNKKDFVRARECFLKADYQSGLIRLGDYYMYERRLPLLAYGYYKKARAHSKVEDLQRRMIGAFAQWVGQDKFKPESQLLMQARQYNVQRDTEGQILVPVAPALREQALAILAGRS